MHRSRVFLYTLLSFVAGVGIRSFWDVPVNVVSMLGIVGGFFLFYWVFARAYSFLGIAGLCILVFSLGVVRFSFYEAAQTEATILKFADSGEVILRGVVVDEPDVREKNTRLVVAVSAAVSDSTTHPAVGNVLLFTDRYPVFAYGDEVTATGNLKRPETFSGFDYPMYLAKDQIFALMYYPTIKRASSGGVSVRGVLFDIKHVFENSIERVFSEPYAAFLKGILLGSRASIPAWLLDAFRITGVMHIIALSGFNITIIADTLSRFLRWLTVSRQGTFWASFALILLFTLMVGASPSIVRAALMGMLVLLAAKEGRQYQGANALVFAGAVMIFHNPAVLRFDVAFQLSFLATAGLFFIAPRIEHWFWFLPEFFGLRGTVTATISAQAAVLPLLLYYFGELSLVSPLTNLLILSLMPMTMLFGFLGALAGMIWTPFGIGIGSIGYALVAYQIWIVSVFSQIPGASLYIGI